MNDKEAYGILVVDDDESTVNSMRRVLRRKGFNKIISALNGEQGIKLLESAKDKFFLIISDCRMPGMMGSDFLEKSIMVSPESRRMFITGFSDVDAIADAINKGAINQFIAKPWNNDDLILKIQGELEIFQNSQERKRLFNVTKSQNAKLLKLLEQQKEQDDSYINEINKKKEKIGLQKKAVIEAKKAAEYKEPFLGLDELLSRTITINAGNLAEAFSIIKQEINTMMKKLSHEYSFAFSEKHIQNTGEPDDDMYDAVDKIIENVVIAVEPDICAIGSEPSTGITIDDYKAVPDFGTVAFNDGYITKGEFEIARSELEEREAITPSGLTMDKILVEKGYIERKDLSRIFAKLALINVRLLDRKFGEMLISRGIATKKDIDRALRKQLNNFEESGITTPIGDLLMVSDVISPELKDEILKEQDRTGKKQGAEAAGAMPVPETGVVVDLLISDDRTQAFIRIPFPLHGTTDVEPVKKLIKKRGITHGIVDDETILSYLRSAKDFQEKFTVAKGTPVTIGKPAEIVYHFNTEHEAKGVIREDGSIDFQSSEGNSFVKKGQIIAEKIPMEQAKPGKDIFGETLLVKDVEDIAFMCGDGAEMSSDGLKITALISGQPILDSQGCISVHEQFTVKGDVDFKTGNIKYKGNVVVFGAVKHGFSVTCEELTANEIDGGILKLSGNLNVSNGIVNADIESQGSIQARFIKNSKIYAHKNMMITREIMESRIFISGELDNTAGRITASVISARKGIKAKQIGTERAAYSTVKAGGEDHVNWIKEKYDKRIEDANKAIELAIRQKMEYDEENNSLHVEVANQTFAQEKIQKQMDFIEQKMVQAKNDKAEKLKLSAEFKELEKNLNQADERIKGIFENQDTVLKKIEKCDAIIQDLNDTISSLSTEKEKSCANLIKNPPITTLRVDKKIFSGTRVEGTSASLTVGNDLGASKFTEVESSNPETPKKMVYQSI